MYAVDPRSMTILQRFSPPYEALGVARTDSEFRLILAPAIDEPDLERDYRYVYSFSPETGFAECFMCPDGSGSFLAYGKGALYVSQAWDKRIVEVDERGAAVRHMQLERRPVGITIVDDAFYLVTVNDDWGDGRFERLAFGAAGSGLESLFGLPFKPRGVAYDGGQFWTADRDNDAIVSLTL